MRARLAVGLAVVGLGAVPASAGVEELSPRVISAAAGSGPRLLVVSVALDGPTEPEARRLEHVAEQVVLRSGRFSAYRIVDALDPAASAREAAAEEGRKSFEAGIKAYDDLETKKAAELFGESLRSYRQSDLTRHFDDLSKAWVMKAAALVANGEHTAAKAEIDRLLAVDRRASFSSNYFSPDLLRYAEAARRSAAAGRQELQIRSGGVPAQIFLDGDFRGVTPMRVGGLPPGDHLLVLLAPGYQYTFKVTAPGLNDHTLREAETAARWRQLVAAVVGDPDGPGRDAALKEIGRYAQAEQVLLVTSRRSTVAGSLDVVALRLDVMTGHNYAFVEGLTPLEDAAAADALLGPLVSSDEPMGGSPVTHFRLPPPAPGVSKKTVGYILLGTAGALLAGGVICGLQANGLNQEFRRTPQVEVGKSEQLKRSGQTFGYLADGLYVGSIAAAVPGGIFAFGSSEAPSARTDPKFDAPADERGSGERRRSGKRKDDPALKNF